MVEPGKAGSELPGVRLGLARERHSLSVAQVAAKLHLDVRVVSALEAGEFAKVGAAVFVRGFLRRYAELVGESPAEIEALYGQQPDASVIPDLAKTGLHRLDSNFQRRTLGVAPALTAVAVLGVIAAVWWAMKIGTATKSTTSVTPAEVLHLSGPAVGSPVAPGTPEGQPGAAPVPAVAAGEPGTDSLFTPLPRKRLQLAFDGECWAEVYDARGMRLYFGFGHAGETQELSGVAPFRLVLGNAGAVTVAFEGTPVELPLAAPGTRLRVSLKGNGTVAGVH